MKRIMSSINTNLQTTHSNTTGKCLKITLYNKRIIIAKVFNINKNYA